ncbi:GntR family transcriptional regulator [Enterococcus timonensis]|uniref:GntR family transcriptional regulator n=1 Tax=Enterococcus timonensis TaxID=1852364 RepID=UPI0008D92A05|nr:GntR family transcriptional regulator [Enterococcus timonensis]
MAKGAVPVYIKIHDQLKNEIEKGLWQVGDRLPAERELAVRFKVSRMTLRQAIQTLADEGILERKVGSGTFVASEKVQEKMTGTTSFTEIMLSQNKKPSSKTIAYYLTKPSSSEMERLQLTDESNIIRMERIRYADGVPICFEVAAIPADLVKDFSKSEVTNSFYQSLANHGFTVGHAEQTISAITAAEQIADYLDMKRGEAILRLRQISYFENGRPFEYVRTQYAGGRFEFYLEK